MSEPGTIKVNLHYGGLMENKDKAFTYHGGSQKKDIVIDPDYMTWSMFDTFCEENSVAGMVEHVWYKLPQEDMSLLKPIFELSSDVSIVQMCREATRGGEVDIFIEQVVSPRVDEERQDDGGDKGEEKQVQSEEEEVQNEEEEDVQNEGEEEEEIIKERGDDIRFETFFNDVRNEECRAGVEKERGDTDNGNEEGHDNEPEDEAELERQLKDDEHLAPAVDTDDEWEDFNRQETTISRKRYSNEKPPYLWLMQTFKSGEEFKDQLLRYVLKTNCDVKLSKWEKTKLAAICTKEKCKWKIYCSVEKPKGKWMVKTYVDQHHHLKSSKAKMLKQSINF